MNGYMEAVQYNTYVGIWVLSKRKSQPKSSSPFNPFNISSTVEYGVSQVMMIS